jgi:serine/threonine protein kinase
MHGTTLAHLPATQHATNSARNTPSCALRAAAPLRVGDLVAGRFRLERHAAAGAHAQVFRAYDLVSEVDVALKLETRSEASARHVRDEAVALSVIDSPWLAGYVDQGITAKGQAFLAMEWIEGPTLAETLAARGVRPLQAFELCARLGQGLAAIHARDIVHRDLKPANIMLEGARAEAPRIVDLGVAHFRAGASDASARDAYVGTPRYMSPEQIRDPYRVDGRSDVFALGCILFECLTGVAAFVASEIQGVLAQILFEPVPSARSRRPELPVAVDELLARLLARTPAERPHSGAELQAELARVRATCGPALAALDAAAGPGRSSQVGGHSTLRQRALGGARQKSRVGGARRPARVGAARRPARVG